ncbi:helix-turn-helix domain-containing protein [bacterium]|nr:helix-turn-helix domain-containing protein [bacterium]
MGGKDEDRESVPQRPTREVMILTELDQIKILADPLRIRILEELSEERTTKQVAERIGEKPTKLYHHVDALERVGLIRPTRTRQNRGTLEKYFVAVARRFEADSRVFASADAPSDEEKGALRAMISTIFDTTAGELTSAVESGRGVETLERDGIVSFLEVRAGKKRIEELRDRLRSVITESTSPDDEGDEDGEGERFRLTLAFFPLEKP